MIISSRNEDKEMIMSKAKERKEEVEMKPDRPTVGGIKSGLHSK